MSVSFRPSRYSRISASVCTAEQTATRQIIENEKQNKKLSSVSAGVVAPAVFVLRYRDIGDTMKKRSKRKQERRLSRSEVVPLTHEQLFEGRRLLQGERCLLCGEPATHLGLFRPPKELAKILGEPPGKIRHFAYPICNDCMHQKDFPQRVEEIIHNDAMPSV